MSEDWREAMAEARREARRLAIYGPERIGPPTLSEAIFGRPTLRQRAEAVCTDSQKRARGNAPAPRGPGAFEVLARTAGRDLVATFRAMAAEERRRAREAAALFRGCYAAQTGQTGETKQGVNPCETSIRRPT